MDDRQVRTMGIWTMDDGGFWTTDYGPRTTEDALDRPVVRRKPLVYGRTRRADFTLHTSLFTPHSSSSPLAVIPETCGLNLKINENESSARYPGSRQDWLFVDGQVWTMGVWTADGGGILDDRRWVLDGGLPRGRIKLPTDDGSGLFWG